MQTKHLFNDKSHIYALARPHYPQSWYDFLANLIAPNAEVWDAACGNGQATYDLAQYFKQIYATDISENQIKHAKFAENIAYSVQASEATDFASNQFDLICVAQALHWFNYDEFWPEIKRVLKAGGVFAAWGYSWFSIADVIDECVKSDLLNTIKDYWAAQNQLLWDKYKTIPFPLSALEVPEIEMQVNYDLNEFMAYLHSWSAVRRCMQDKGEGFFEAFRLKLSKIWGPTNAKRTLAMPMCIVLGMNN